MLAGEPEGDGSSPVRAPPPRGANPAAAARQRRQLPSAAPPLQPVPRRSRPVRAHFAAARRRSSGCDGEGDVFAHLWPAAGGGRSRAIAGGAAAGRRRARARMMGPKPDSSAAKVWTIVGARESGGTGGEGRLRRRGLELLPALRVGVARQRSGAGAVGAAPASASAQPRQSSMCTSAHTPSDSQWVRDPWGHGRAPGSSLASKRVGVALP